MAAIRIERVDADRHDRSSFCCGDLSLDRWLRDDASAASTTSGLRVEVASNGNQVVGCYALSSFHVEVGRAIGLSGSRHPPLPAILMSRLGVDIRWQRRGLGTSLMVHAIGLANDAAPALNAALLVARAESDPGTAFCTRFGFEPFRSRPGWLYRPLRDVEATLSRAAPRPRGASRSR